jgi:glycosyltransferase involved in cell wall biosynthesis
MRLSVVIPCYKEGISIKKTVETVTRILCSNGLDEKDFEVILVVEKSYSAAQSYALRLEQAYSHVKVAYNDAQYGKGYTVKRGILMSGGDTVFVLDADLPVDLEKYYPLMDLLIQSPQTGAVYLTALGDKTSAKKRGTLRALTTFGLFTLRTIFLGVHITDTQFGCKLYRGDVIRKMMPFVNEPGFLYELLITDLISESGYDIEECSARIRKFSTESSVTLKAILHNSLTFLKYILFKRERVLAAAGLKSRTRQF